MDEPSVPNSSSSLIPEPSTPRAPSRQPQDLPTARKPYQTQLNQVHNCDDGDDNDNDNDSTAARSQPPASLKPPLSVDTSRERQCTSSPNTGVPSLAASSQSSPPKLARSSSFRALVLPQSPLENDRFGYILGRSFSSSTGQNCFPSNSSMTSLRTFSCTPTTENLARRMAHSSTSNHSNNPSISSPDTETYSQPMLPSQHPTPSGDGPSENQNQGFDAQNSPTASFTTNPSTQSLSATREDGATTKADLVSYLPKIPVASTTASEEERVAKWGPKIGPPTSGDEHKNPYNYEVLDTYYEQADHPMFNVAESTRRAGISAA
ncbi:hypothetical protein AOL_s00112g101 [Orbilia oligospora ATCC 24927]|uniref:Uncharacterized protein n=1 Tax=Arthrobotrys oligospora (strain ATCC 24927 / CBS 115.81 / DSM 1491) TaxID=756982 RepID=G1XLS1_ARTOA|nr:hypothetical protein AOL_s00112g101 [Orbilia oligospora ATCC 24927]EGX45912.1 hypothetical protein AOL_s00112g101 [Orbilia oligospora ATCC 24927]